jgi:CBS domain-containing protein
MGERVGSVSDVVVRLRDDDLPVVSGFVAHVAARDVFIPLAQMAQIEEHAARLTTDAVDLRAFERRPGEILLIRDLVGRHVIHVSDGRLVHVKDLRLGQRDEQLLVTHIVEGPGPWFDRLFSHVGRRGDARPPLEWSAIEPLLGHVPTVRRRLPFARLARLHPARLADIVETASPAEGEEILSVVGEDRALEADVFEELDEDVQVELLRSRSDADVAEVLANMSPDAAADTLLEFDDERRRRLLGRLPLAQLHKVRNLLGYNPETAGGLMSSEFLSLQAATQVSVAVDAVRGSSLPPAVVDVVYVLDDAGRLLGAVSAVELIRQDPATVLETIATPPPISVPAHADIPEIAVAMTDFNLGVLPVVENDGRMLGVITVDDLLEEIVPDEWRVRVQHYPPTNHASQSADA